jgi:hypothetical protein
VVVTLAWSGLVWGQSPSVPVPPPPTASPKAERYLLVGDPPQKCRVLTHWVMEGGRQAYDVQSLDNGEVITLYETPDRPAQSQGGGLLSRLRMRICHWGGAHTRPEGFPAPPPSVSVARRGTVISGNCPNGTCARSPYVSTLPMCDSPGCAPKVAAGPPPQPTPEPPMMGRSEWPGSPMERQLPAVGGVQPWANAQNSKTLAEMATQSPPAPLPAGPALPTAPTPRVVSSPPSPGQPAAAKPALAPAPVTAQAPKVQPQKTETTTKASPVPLPPAMAAPPAASQIVKKVDPSLPTSQTQGLGHTDPLVAKQYLTPAAAKMVSATGPAPASVTAAGASPYATPLAVGGAPVAPKADPMAVPPGVMPLGAGSVLAASNGADMPTRYVPVPTVVIPPSEPPQPPVAQVPEPPQVFQNAFSSDIRQVPPGNPYGQQPAGPGGYPPAGYGPQAQGMGMYPPAGAMPQYPYPQGSMGRPMSAVDYNRAYHGPTPPNPVANEMPKMPSAGPVAAYPMMDLQMQPVAYQAPAGVTPAALEAMLATLRDALYPSQRENTACALANLDWRAYPQVLPALLTAASQDPAATVRVACAECLSRMNTGAPQVRTTLEALRNDSDPRVRQAAAQALARMAPGTATGIQQVSAISRR